MRESCQLVSRTHGEVALNIKPGITTRKLDDIAESFIRDNDAIPGFKGYRSFPFTLCISINNEVVHGMPGDREIQPGDIISIDCGVVKNDFYGDCAYTYIVGETSEEVKLLLQTTEKALYLGIEQAVAGKRLGDISFAIQNYAEREKGYGVVRELVGHGVGKNLHETPEVPNFGKRGSGPKLKPGLVIAIEPMVNMGGKAVEQCSDGWTVVTRDGSTSAHFEHTVAISGENGADILTTFEYAQAAVGSNVELTNFN